MFSKGLGLLSIPETEFAKFNNLLINYYNDGFPINELKILSFMYEYCVFGINYLSK